MNGSSERLPGSWITSPLSLVAEHNPRTFSRPATDDTLVSFVPMKSVEAETGRIAPAERRRWGDVRKGYTPFQEGDVIVAKITPCMENGKFAVAAGLEGGRAAGSTEFHVFRPSARLEAKFLLFFLFQSSVRRKARMHMRGAAGQLRVPAAFFEELQIPIPPVGEQRRIVAEIEKQYTRLEAGTAALGRLAKNLKRYRAAILNAACEGRLVPTAAKLARQGNQHFESAKDLLTRTLKERQKRLEGRKANSLPKGPKTAGLGSLPEGWTWATFEQLCERVTVGFVGPMKHEYVETGIPFLRSQNVRENRFDAEGLLSISERFHRKLAKSVLRAGDLVVVRSGSVGVTCVIPETIQEANCADLVILQRPIGFIPKYGAYYMNSLAKRHVAAGKVGIALTHFNTKSVAQLAVPLPPISEQMRIVAEVERRMSIIDELEIALNSNLARASGLWQAILRRAYTGSL